MELLNLIDKRINRAIEERVFPGCVIGIVKKTGERIVLPFGRFTHSETSPRMLENSIFDVASITKSIPVSCLTLKLIDDGKLHAEDRLIQFLPEFSNPDRERILIKHLLTHTLDFNFRLSSYKDKDPKTIMKIIFTTPFASEPGKNFRYSNPTSILLGLVVERVFGESLDSIADRIFFKPLKMERTTFHPLEKFPKLEIVPTEIDSWRGRLIHGEIHDESAYRLYQRPRFHNTEVKKGNLITGHESFLPSIPGSAGLFSTAPDLMNFLEMLLNEGRLYDRFFFSTEMVKSMYSNQLEEIGQSTGLGWELNQQQYMGSSCTENTFGKTGFTGCVCICDIPREIGIVLLSNYTYPVRKWDKEIINRVRRDLADIVITYPSFCAT